MPAVLCCSCCCCCYCCTALATSEKSPSLHSIHPIELPALVINSEPCAVTAGLWTQQLAAGRQALFHRGCPLISCTQLSSSSPAIQSTAAAAAGEGGLFHCCHWPCCPGVPFTIFSFSLIPSYSLNSAHTSALEPRSRPHLSVRGGSLVPFALSCLSSRVKLSICLCLY